VRSFEDKHSLDADVSDSSDGQRPKLKKGGLLQLLAS
jgi:hypothetical protein